MRKGDFELIGIQNEGTVIVTKWVLFIFILQNMRYPGSTDRGADSCFLIFSCNAFVDDCDLLLGQPVQSTCEIGGGKRWLNHRYLMKNMILKYFEYFMNPHAASNLLLMLFPHDSSSSFPRHMLQHNICLELSNHGLHPRYWQTPCGSTSYPSSPR